MKVTTVIVLSAIAAIACASHTVKPQSQSGRDLYAHNRFAKRGLFDNLTGFIPGSLSGAGSSMTPQASAAQTTDEELLKRSDDGDCEEGDDDGNDHGHHSKPPHHGHHGGDDHHSGGGGSDIDFHIGLDTIINAKIGVIVKAYLGIALGALVDIKADILAKIALKLKLDLKANVDLGLKIKAIVDAKVDTLIKAKLDIDIRAKIGALVHGRCKNTCGVDVDAGILADITEALKIDLGHILADIDADILADIRVRLNALGLKIKADVNLVLGLNLGAILRGLVGDCDKSRPAILADIKLAVLAKF
ncbi:hypothetical protein BGX23_001400 [Mortierella sp. AD031]|nr:hypothetical protein BGX23_001400 [Mortierella sp. AD031]